MKLIQLIRSHRDTRTRRGVLVCGAYGRGNAGDEAILEAILTELRQIDPELPLWVLTRRPAAARRIHGVHALYTFDPFAFRRAARKCALYVNGGGSLMQDVTSRRSLWFYLSTIRAAKRLGCKVMMYGCGIGPIRSPFNRRLAAKIMDRADVITLRDALSRDELARMGVRSPRICLSADPTVILPPASRSEAEDFLLANGLDPAGRYIGFSVRPWKGFEHKAAVFAAAADYAFETYGLTPLFLPIEARPDREAARMVTAHLRSAPAHVLPACPGSALTIALFARMEAVVSMRLHALIFSAGQGVPLVGVVYDPKVSSFLDAVGQDLYAPLDGLTAEALCAQVDAAAARIGNAALLDAGVKRLRELELQNVLLASDLLGKDGRPAP